MHHADNCPQTFYRPVEIDALNLPPNSYGLGPKRSLALAAFLKTFQVATLRSLNIEGCGVPESAMASILQALKEEGRGLISLDISGNQIKKASTAEILSGKDVAG